MGTVEGEQGEPGDDRRQREGEVDDRVDQGLATKVVADQHPGDGEAGGGVDHGDGERRTEGQLQRRDGLGLGDGAPELAPAPAERIGEERGQGQQDEQRQAGDGDNGADAAPGHPPGRGQGVARRRGGAAVPIPPPGPAAYERGTITGEPQIGDGCPRTAQLRSH